MFIGLEIKATADGEFKFDTDLQVFSFSLTSLFLAYILFMMTM